MVLNSGFCHLLGWNLFEGKMRNIRPNASMFYGYGAKLTFSIQIDQGIFVQISGFCHVCFPELNVESVRISKVFHFHGLNPRSKIKL